MSVVGWYKTMKNNYTKINTLLFDDDTKEWIAQLQGPEPGTPWAVLIRTEGDMESNDNRFPNSKHDWSRVEMPVISYKYSRRRNARMLLWHLTLGTIGPNFLRYHESMLRKIFGKKFRTAMYGISKYLGLNATMVFRYVASEEEDYDVYNIIYDAARRAPVPHTCPPRTSEYDMDIIESMIQSYSQV